MKFTFHQIPDAALHSLGVNREQLERLPFPIQKPLLNGLRTSLVRLTHVSLSGENVKRILDAHLSLFRKPDQSVGMMVHPIHPIRTPQSEFTAGGHFLSGQENTSLNKLRSGKQQREENRSVSLDASANINTVEKMDEKHDTTVNPSDRKPIGIVDTGNSSRDPHEVQQAPAAGPNLVIGKIGLGHSRMQDTDVFIDIGLLASGLGTIILLEHLADLALHSRLQHKTKYLRNPSFRDALAAAAENISRRGMPTDAKGLSNALQAELKKAGFGEQLGAHQRTQQPESSSALRNNPSSAVRHRSHG
jgi:hypothetical protein